MDIVKQTKIPESGWTQHYDVTKELGDCYASVGEYDKARECYDKAASLAPDEAGPYVGFGVIAMQTGELEDAETAFKVARRLDPQCSKAYCGLAMICQQRSKGPEAFDLYLKSLELDSDNLTALLGLFQSSCAMGSFSKVISYLEIYLDKHPGDTTVMFCLATLQMKDNQPQKARQLLLNILALDAENTDAVNLLEEAEHMLAQVNRS
ncbi:MAG: tetratricopeptide repeat protein [Planctomycetota bacterium]|jgi:tetratricopeptide (TPR) repeat protein